MSPADRAGSVSEISPRHSFLDYKRKNYGTFFLKFSGAQIRNKLPNDLKIIASCNSFKKMYLSLCAKSNFYSQIFCNYVQLRMGIFFEKLGRVAKISCH